MITKKNLTAAAVAGILSASVLLSGAEASEKKAMEKCYGVAKAEKNDCGANGHSCAAQAKVDGDAHEWVMLPAGTCDKIVGGNTVKPMAKMKKDHKMKSE